MINKQAAIAHVRNSDKTEQLLHNHLFSVAIRSARYASAIGLPGIGLLLGLLHDLGKYSAEFQNYLRSGTGLMDQDSDDYVDAAGLKGKIDHSTAGAQYLWQSLDTSDKKIAFMAEMLCICLVSHHSGVIDVINPEGRNLLEARINKAPTKTNLPAVYTNIDSRIKQRIDSLLGNATLLDSFLSVLQKIIDTELNVKLRAFQTGMFLRFLYSSLIDADRCDTADFEKPIAARFRSSKPFENWADPIQRLEKKYASFSVTNKIDHLRTLVADECLQAAERPLGVYSLTVPTGGGKTFASLRYALRHAQKHQLERIIYIIPFTSIIDQNAQEIRDILESDKYGPAQPGRLVLEHHSNLTPEEETWQQKILSENWDAPIVFTTSVQVLEAMFGSGTRSARRFHQLAHSVLIFDEAQTIPIRTVHLFNNAINFLVRQCGSSVVMCTATQPLLDKVNPEFGTLQKSPHSEIINDVEDLFQKLKRVEINDIQRPGGYQNEEIAEIIQEQLICAGSVLLIANTKAMARDLFSLTKASNSAPETVFHLSTNMCPAHRLQKLGAIRQKLSVNAPVICISTQLIEAGVDVDFGAVIRLTAGIDSIAQAAGRCNRNGRRSTGIVTILNPSNERLGNLKDIEIGIEKTGRVLRELTSDSALAGFSILDPPVMERYYRYYFFDRQQEMVYPVGPKSPAGMDDSIFNLLSNNGQSVHEYKNQHNGTWPTTHFWQAFMTAAKCFQAIDSNTRGIIVPFGDEGTRIITALFAAAEPEKQYALLKESQRYSVNVYENKIAQLHKAKALTEIGDTGIMTLDAQYYSDDFGLSAESENLMNVLLG